MQSFCCKHCGMITDNPELFLVGFTLAGFHYEIKCSVCEQSTDFWRPEPFPTDKPDDIPYPVLRLELRADTRLGEILQEELDKAEAKGCNVTVIELPKFAHFKGIPIRYY